MFPQHRASLRNCFYPGRNVCLPCWTCIESFLHLQLLNPTQAHFQKILTIGLMQIRYVVTPFLVFSNNLFDVYCFYKEAKYIWDSLILKYTVEDVVRQRFVTKNCYHLEMIEDKDIHMKNVIDIFQLLTFLLKLIIIDFFLSVERTWTLMLCFHQRMNLKEWEKKRKRVKK